MQFRQFVSLICALFVLLALSCSKKRSPSSEEKKGDMLSKKAHIRRNAEKHLETLLDNPATYQYDTLILVDSVTYRHNVQNRYRFFKNALAREKWQLLILKEQHKTDTSGKAVKQMESRIQVLKGIVHQLDSLHTRYQEDVSPEAAAYLYSYQFHGENSYGAVKPFEYYVQTTPETPYKIIRITNDSSDLHPYPNAFPGYDSLQNAYRKQLGRQGIRYRLRP